MLKGFPLFKQRDQMDCGPTCLKMIAQFYGRSYPLPYLGEISFINREGVSLEGIVEAAEQIGFRTMPIRMPFKKNTVGGISLQDAPFPCILHWDQNHFVVAYKSDKKYVWIADPAEGKLKISHNLFKKSWASDKGKGIALLLEPTPVFYEKDGIENGKKNFNTIPGDRRILQRVFDRVLSMLKNS